MDYPIVANRALVKPDQIAAFTAMLFGYVENDDGAILIRGVGEKNTPQEGVHREPAAIDPRKVDVAQALTQHALRWAQYGVATFILPAVMAWDTAEDKKGTEDRVRLFTTLVVDLDAGAVAEKLAWLKAHVGEPTMVVHSGGTTSDGELKIHAWYRLSEPTAELAKVAALREALALKVGGDTSFKRIAQVIRVPGTVWAKGGEARTCSILEHEGKPWQ